MPADQKTTKGSVDQFANTRTPRKQLSEDELLNQVGGTGTYIVNGFLEADYNSALSGVSGLRKYDEMRKSDAQIRASLMVCKLPLISTEWYFEPAKNHETGEVGEDEQAVADFCTRAFFEKMKHPFNETLMEILTMLEFGHSVFEKVYTADEEDEFIWLDKLATRKQTTIQKWEMEDGSPGITQILPQTITDPTHVNFGKSKVSIPSGKLLVFSYQREGDNYAGVSILRSAYKHWYIKDSLYKFDTIKHERQGVGVPVIELPKGSTDNDKQEARNILKNIRANEQGGVILPKEGWKFYFADLQAGNTSDIWKSIEHHNAMIAKNVLAMFMELISGDGGSRALSEDQSDFFLLSQESVANMIEEVINRHCVPELVDLNFDVKVYPKLKHKKLGNVDYTSMASTLSTLVSSGALSVDDDLEAWVRKMIDAPAKTIEEPMVDENGNEIDEDGNSIDPETGEPIVEDPLIDPETVEPIDETMMDEEITDESIEDVEPEELGEEDLQATEDAMFILANDDCTEEEYEDAMGVFIDVVGKEQGFRVVSEETKRKISEALKKALPNKPVVPPRYKRGQPIPEDIRRKIAEAVAKAKPGDMNNPKKKPGKLKRGGVIAQARAKRLAKAGIKDTAARKKANKKVISDLLSGKKPTTKKQKSSKVAKALKPKKPKTAKAKKPKATKVKKPKTTTTVKKPVSVTVPVTAQRASQQVKDKNSPLYKAKATKVKNALSPSQKRIADRKAKRLAKRTVKAHEHENDAYADIFNEGAKLVMELQSQVHFEKGNLPQGPQKFSEGNKYDAWRPLTFAEEKINWKSMSKIVNKFQSALDSEVKAITADQKRDLLEQVRRAVDGNDIVSVGVLKAKYTGDLSAALTNVQKEMFEAGKTSVALEMGVKAPATAKEVMGAMKVSNAKLVQKLTGDMEHAAADAVAQVVMKKGGAISSTGTTEAVSAASEAIDRVLEDTAKINTLTLYGSLNLGRASIFERYPEKVYAFQYSAIIDAVTTDTCLSLDGRVVKAGSGDFYSYNPPLHYNCRSIWVEILEDEEFKPDTEDIPSRIPTNKTIDGFKDVSAPVVKENSPAIKVIKAEIEERQAKVKEYEDAGTHADRIANHKSRINDLEDALADNVSLGSIDISEKERVDKGGK